MYITHNATCPECGGEGTIDTMTWLTFVGGQRHSVETCPECGGVGAVDASTLCPYCWEPIMRSESAIDERGKACHAECLEGVQ